MISQKQVDEICKNIAKMFHPEKIVLFGSYAQGTAGPYSDLDLLVVMPFEGSPLSQAAKIITKLKPSIALDLVIRTPEQIAERIASEDGFIKEIFEHGKIAYPH